MKARNTWATAVATICIAATVPLAAAYVSTGLTAMLYLVSSLILLATAAVVAIARGRYLRVIDRDSTIECLRLKRPGAEMRPEEQMVPKGKMPK
jgi:small-conductance mechanosensitive channel